MKNHWVRKCVEMILLLLVVFPGQAQERPGRGRMEWRYDIGFQYYFDNREFDASEPYLLKSGTTHAAVLTPTVSALWQPSRRVRHTLTMGADFQHDMGVATWNGTFREGILYYDGQVRTRKGMFEGVAGIYPRALMREFYSEAFFSDLNRFQDRYFEGVLLKWAGRRFHTEMALDWLGKKSYESKERFQIISAGSWAPANWLALGWAADYFHYAGSWEAPGVVDHGLLHPWLKLGLVSPSSDLSLNLRLGAILSYQWDRRRADKPSTPGGGEATLTLCFRSLSLENNSYFGDDLLPLYDGVDTAGHPYADNLYFGHRFYTGFYDRIGLFWEPRIGKRVRFRLGARAHFTSTGYMGWQQTASLRFDFGEAKVGKLR